jgi:drug/metabolite transporter (DMT)-like permease
MSLPAPPVSSHSPTRLRLLAVAVTVLWSSSWVLIRSGLDEIDTPLTLAGMRYALAAIALTCWRRTTRRRVTPWQLSRRDLVALVALGLVQYALTQGAQFVAIASQPLATTSLLLAATPLLVALGGRLIGEPLTVRQLVGGTLICLGAAVYFQGELGATVVGLAAAIIGLGANAASALGGRSLLRATPLSPAIVTEVSMAVGAAALLAAGIATEGWPAISIRLASIIVWLAIVNTAAAFTWWNVCLRGLPATEVAAINTTMAVQIPLLGWLVFGEALGWSECLGLAVVVGAVLLVVLPRRRAP